MSSNALKAVIHKKKINYPKRRKRDLMAPEIFQIIKNQKKLLSLLGIHISTQIEIVKLITI